jgi:hypothetical protein
VNSDDGERVVTVEGVRPAAEPVAVRRVRSHSMQNFAELNEADLGAIAGGEYLERTAELERTEVAPEGSLLARTIAE